MTQPLRIAVAGLGNVGAGTVKLLQLHAEDLARRCERAIEIRAVSARDRKRDRGVDLAGLAWHDEGGWGGACDPVSWQSRGHHRTRARAQFHSR
jgi:homoserine dehydrogenase